MTRELSIFERSLSALACVSVLATFAACRDARESSPARRVILISCDTLRADQLGMYARDLDTSPHLDAFARDAVVYDEAFACAPLTGPALSSLLTGRMPDEIGVAEGNRFLMPSEVTTLAELCRDAGLSTGAVVSNWVLRKMHPSLGDVGVSQGFASFDDEMPAKERNRDAFERVAPDTTDAAIRWLAAAKERGDDRFFFWTHYQDPHGPYTAPARFETPLPAADAVGKKLALGRTNKGKGQLPAYQLVLGDENSGGYVARYQAEIRYFDESVGKLLAWLAENDWIEDSLIVFTADHGESLGEHDYWFCHGEHLYRDCVRVPLVIRFPERTGGTDASRTHGARRVDTLVSHLDFWPTVAEALGLDAAKNRGASLFALPTAEKRVAVQTLGSDGSATRWVSITDGEHRLILEASLPPRLFNAKRDHAESVDLAATLPDRVRELSDRCRAFLSASAQGSGPGKTMQLDPESKAAMQRLGYTEGEDGD